MNYRHGPAFTPTKSLKKCKSTLTQPSTKCISTILSFLDQSTMSQVLARKSPTSVTVLAKIRGHRSTIEYNKLHRQCTTLQRR